MQNVNQKESEKAKCVTLHEMNMFSNVSTFGVTLLLW